MSLNYPDASEDWCVLYTGIILLFCPCPYPFLLYLGIILLVLTDPVHIAHGYHAPDLGGSFSSFFPMWRSMSSNAWSRKCTPTASWRAVSSSVSLFCFI